MRILVVEDDEEFAEEIERILKAVPAITDIKIARSRDSAYSIIETDFADLIILDLKIPTVDAASDEDPVHGQAVFAKSRSLAPGTPIFILTGSPAESFIPYMLEQQQRLDIWSSGRTFGTVDFLKKYDFDKFGEKLAPVIASVHSLNEIELDTGALILAIEVDRLIRIFSRKCGGAKCVVSLIGGGLSGALVIRLKITDRGGTLVHDAVAKIGSHSDVRDECERFDRFISRLDPDATPRKLAHLEYGAKARSGVFYGLADRFELTAFQVAGGIGNPDRTVQGVASALRRWSAGVPESRREICEVRRRLLSDADLDRVVEKYGLSWVPEFESKSIQMRWCIVHGDLHGSNVLTSSSGESVVIDYGDVSEGPVSLDPMTLELSLFFHPQSPLRGSNWPTSENCAHWGDLERYLVGCPCAAFIRECREWARRVAAGRREIAASAYSYLIRQLKYDDTDKALVRSLLDGVKTYFDAT